MNFKFSVFFSYHRDDQQWVSMLKKALALQNINVWFDQNEKELGENSSENLEKGLNESKSIVIVISPKSLASGWVKEEYTRAVTLAIQSDTRRPIIPIILRDAKLPDFMQNRQWIDFRDDSNFHEKLKKLIWSIQGICIEPVVPEGPEALDTLMGEAKKTLIISGHTLDKFSEHPNFTETVIGLLNKGIKVTIILLNPHCSYAKAHEPFHVLESRTSAQLQANNTITKLRNIYNVTPRNAQFEVILSNYMPRFRTIIIDEKICLINLYMFKKDVGVTPNFNISRDGEGFQGLWFETIYSSIQSMLQSPYIIPLIKNGKFNEFWMNSRVSHVMNYCLETSCCKNRSNCWDVFRKVILGYQNEDSDIAKQHGIVNNDYKPGTFTLSNISAGAKFLVSPEPFNNWLSKAINDHLTLIEQQEPQLFQNMSKSDVAEKMQLSIIYAPSDEKPLKEQIWYQEYSDIIHRLAMTLLTGYPEHEINLYKNLTINRKDFIISVIKYIEEHRTPGLKDWLSLSIAAGLLGIDEKPAHAATSSLNNQFAIRLNQPGPKLEIEVERVSRELWELSKTPCRIDASAFFFHMLKTNNIEQLNMVSFSDDYLETIFLLKFYEELLKKFKMLHIHLVPRSTRCSNDATFNDIQELLDFFPFLSNSDRFNPIENGPKIGGLNLRKIDHKIVDYIDRAFILDVRGARNYEMMQGINKQTFFGFMVCREFSESVTGLLADDKPLIYLHHAPGEYSFKGFKNRYKRIENGRMFTLQTVSDQKSKWEGGELINFKKWADEKKTRYDITTNFYINNAVDFHRRWGDIENIEQEVREFLNDMAGKILVLGCGSGKEVAYLCEKRDDAYGIDISSEAILIAQKVHSRYKNRFFVEDIYNLDTIMSGEFDGIVANASLLHLWNREDFELILQKIWKKLKRNGKCFIRLIDKFERVEFKPLEFENILDHVPRRKNVLLEMINRTEPNYTIEINQLIRHFERNEIDINDIKEILAFGVSLKEEIDNDDVSERWFVYYSEKELKELSQQIGFNILKFEINPHVRYPNVFWNSILLEKQ